MDQSPSSTDVEVLETWYPFLVVERRVRPGVNGAGERRSGSGVQMKLQPYGGHELSGQMLGTREWLPLDGAAGGYPGSTAVYEVERADGSVERISTKASGIVLHAGDTFEVRAGSSGGLGDPLDRDPEAVVHDVATTRITRADAERHYGVVIDDDGAVDATATAARRVALLASRLARATAPARPLTADDVAGVAGEEPLPLYPGVVQRGAAAFAERSGTPLAVAPDHWTDGCAVLEEPLPERGPGREVVVRSYIDPATGRSLYVESVPSGAPRAFAVNPKRWTDAGTG
jgi:N-methylhydantoinase B